MASTILYYHPCRPLRKKLYDHIYKELSLHGWGDYVTIYFPVSEYERAEAVRTGRYRPDQDEMPDIQGLHYDEVAHVAHGVNDQLWRDPVPNDFNNWNAVPGDVPMRVQLYTEAPQEDLRALIRPPNAQWNQPVVHAPWLRDPPTAEEAVAWEEPEDIPF